MALSTQGVGPAHVESRVGIKVGDQLARSRRLVGYVLPLQDVRPLRAVGTVRARASELAIVITVVAIGAEDLRAHGSSLGNTIEIQHIRKQAGLRQRTVTGMGHWMARRGVDAELRDQV